MPCWTITEVKLKLDNPNIDLLKKAIKAVIGIDSILEIKSSLSWQGGNYKKETGILTTRNEAQGREIKRAYSAELVKAQAKRFGWQIKEVEKYKYQITKR